MRAMGEGRYGELMRFIRYTEQELGVKICVKESVSFLSADHDLSKALIGHLAHSNPFCMYMKSNPGVYLRCTDMMSGVSRRLEADPRSYCGFCHAGVREYISPIRWDGRLIGSVHAGVFSVEAETARRLIGRVCRPAGLDAERAFALYQAHVSRSGVDEERLKIHLEMIASAIALVFARLSLHGDYLPLRSVTVNAHNTIVSDAVAYLNQNYRGSPKLREVAEHCHCSVSCLSHLFKGHTGMSVPQYLMKVRTDRAFDALIHSDDPIAVVAEQSGFVDPNYFSRVFTHYQGLTPSQFRKRFSKAAGEEEAAGDAPRRDGPS
ncbi:MAG: helix-turn-helix domain-containing protein [Clostridia bacterium]|nr:helix-turn-helix domain-containing protein [Clostridia bacterium]